MTITVRQAAKMLNVSQTHVARLARLGTFPGARKEDRVWRIPLADVNDHLAQEEEIEPIDAESLYRSWCKLNSADRAGKEVGLAGYKVLEILRDAGYDVSVKASNQWRQAKRYSQGDLCTVACPFNAPDLPDCLDVGCHIPEWWDEMEDEHEA